MGLRTLAITFGVATALSAQFAIALGLGEIKLNSTLNQPLNAEIQLLEVRDLSEQEILVGLASLEDFNRVGVDRPFFLSDLDFAVNLDSRGGAVVSITSEKPVREPFLNFVVEAQWPSGRLLREYTLLMDLPVFSKGQQAAPVQPATQAPAATGRADSQRPAPATQERRSSPSAPAESRAQASGAGSTYGPVSASDTLWDIAVATRADRSISIQQSMIAIQRANPGAFINDNINLLRRGQVLRIPAADEMRALTSREAIAEVAYQNQRWSGADNTAGAAPQLEGSKSYTTSDGTSSAPEGRVKLASPEDFSNSNEGRGTGSSGGSVDALESELAVTLEELDKSKSENAELRSRIAAMEAQIETMERLVDVSSEEMRALQLAAQQTRDAANDPSVGEDDTAAGLSPEDAAQEGVAQSGDEIADAGDQQPSDSLTQDPTESDLTADQDVIEPTNEESVTPEAVDPDTDDAQAEAEPVKAAPDPTRVVRSAPAAKPGILDLLLDNLLFIVLGFVALIAAVAVFLRTRNNDSDDDDFDSFVVDQESDDFETVEPYDEAEGNDDDLGSLDLGDDDEHFLAEEADEQEEHRAEQETEDAVAEADIYIALAKYEEAEDILLRALEKEPTDTNIRLKLLELYAAQQDLESFDPHYAKLRAIADDDVIERGENLRRKIAGAPEFDASRFDTSDAVVAGGMAGGALAAAGDENPDDDLLLDLDNELNFDDIDASGASTSTSDLDEEINSTLNETEDDLADFDLDLGDDFATDVSTPESPQGDDDDFSFDFELDASGDQLTADGEVPSDQVALGDELTLDVDTDSTPATGVESDSDSLDFDLSAEFGQALGDQSEVNDENDLEFSLDDELGADDLTAEDLTGDTSELEALNIDEPETLEDAVAFDLGTGEAESDDDSLDRELDADMDLSALDDELNAMTSGLDADLAGLDATLDIDTDADLGSTAAADTLPESTSPAAENAPTVMDEPDIDFDELDNLDLESVTAEAEDTSADDAADSTPTLNDEHVIDEPLDLSGDFDLDAGNVGADDSAAPATDTPAAVEQVETAADEDLTDTDNLMSMNESDFELHDIDPESDDDSDLGFLSDSDETATKLDLARAYMDMGDADGAKDILEEIIHEGNEEQRGEAQKLLDRV